MWLAGVLKGNPELEATAAQLGYAELSWNDIQLSIIHNQPHASTYKYLART